MRNNNIFSDREYINESLYWAFLVFMVYKGTLFYPVFPEQKVLSVSVLLATVIFGMSWGYLLTRHHQRNHFSIACNLALSFGIYFFISFWSVNRSRMLITGAAALVLAGGYFLTMMCRYKAVRRQNRRRIHIRKYLQICRYNCRTIVAMVLAVAITLTWVGSLLGFSVIETKKRDISANMTNPVSKSELIADNQDVILLLRAGEWSNLDATARLDVLKTVADIEAGCLGISEVRLCSDILEDYVLGQYDERADTISLSLNYLVSESAYTMLETLCHEIYHAYQHRIVAIYDELSPENKELLLFSDAARYQLEFGNYIDGTEDYWGYCLQQCEIDSDAYAARSAADYFEYIEEYESEEE